MRVSDGVFLVAVVAMAASPNIAGATPIPVLDPGFDIFVANTTTIVPDDRFPNLSAPGAGSGPLEDVSLLNFNTFAAAGFGDIPAGWTATGQRPSGANNTGRLRCDDCFDSDSGTVASINSFGADQYESPPDSGMFVSTPGIFTQTLPGVAVLPNTLYTATIEVSDLDITGRGPFVPPDDNVVPGDPARILLILSARDSSVTPAVHVLLGGVLEFSDITPGGFFGDHDTNPETPPASISGGKSLLTLTALTGAEVPVGELTISFTAAGQTEPHHGFAPSAQTYFDNVTLDATPFGPTEDADFDGDDDVDGNDFLIWQRGFGIDNGSAQLGAGDANGDGNVSDDDFLIFRRQFGEATASVAATGAVPEPASGILLAIAVISGLLALKQAGSTDAIA